MKTVDQNSPSPKVIISEILKKKKITAANFAKLTGMKDSHVRELLTGRTRNISPSVVALIEKAFPDINTQWMMTGEGEMIKTNEVLISPNENQQNATTLMLQKQIDRLCNQVDRLENRIEAMRREGEEKNAQNAATIKNLTDTIRTMADSQKTPSRTGAYQVSPYLSEPGANT